jgi:ATP-dependent RNA helicase MSS116
MLSAGKDVLAKAKTGTGKTVAFLVFCTTAMVTKRVAEILSQLKLNVREIHSRKAQSARTKVSDEFRR